MKFNKQKINFAILMLLFGAVIMASVYKIGKDKKEKRQEFLRRSFSPMSEDPEIKEAFEVIRNK